MLMLASTSHFLAQGILPFRGSIMLDVVSIAMLAVVIVLTFSIYQIRARKNPRFHRNLQIAIAGLLAIALIAFEIDMRLFTDWQTLARPSPYFDSGWVHRILAIHLFLAIPTPIVWAVLIGFSLRKYNTQQQKFNDAAGRAHRIAGRIAAAMMYATAVTGWVFYYVAFVA